MPTQGVKTPKKGIFVTKTLLLLLISSMENNYSPNFNPKELDGLTEYEQDDYDMHVEAGLVYAGIDADGRTEWLGEKENWERYNEIKNNLI